MSDITVECANVWFIKIENQLTDHNAVDRFCNEFNVEIDRTSCIGLSLYTKLSRNMIKIASKRRSRSKDLKPFLDSVFHVPVHALSQDLSPPEMELLRQNKQLKNETEKLKRQLESEEDIHEKYATQLKCMKEMSNNLSRIIIRKKVVEHEFETMKIIFLKNEKELAALEENLQKSYKYKERNIQLNSVALQGLSNFIV